MQTHKNIFLKIEYAGTGYHGWQTQRSRTTAANQKTATIQQTLENVLEKILQQKICLIGSGRTDAGVHAKAQCANFKTQSGMPLKKMKTALNALLAQDIRVISLKYVRDDFHSRYSAKSKVYRYVILNNEHGSAFLRDTALHICRPLDVPLMEKEAANLKGRHDFKSFQAADKKDRSSVRTIYEVCVKKKGNLIFIDIEADGFLYNMVRNIAGTLIEIGMGRMKSGAIKELLRKKNRKYAGPTALAKGLCLLKVKY